MRRATLVVCWSGCRVQKSGPFLLMAVFICVSTGQMPEQGNAQDPARQRLPWQTTMGRA